MKASELTAGMLMGHFKLLKRVGKIAAPTRTKWRATCTLCNTDHTIPANYFIRPTNPKIHCGCANRSLRTTQNREYRIWIMMRVRTSDPKHKAFKDYGGRGIKVCDEWFNWDDGFEKFFAHIGAAPSLKYTLDRIDNEKGYEPNNVKWSTAAEQRANQRPRAPRVPKPKPIPLFPVNAFTIAFDKKEKAKAKKKAEIALAKRIKAINAKSKKAAIKKTATKLGAVK